MISKKELESLLEQHKKDVQKLINDWVKSLLEKLYQLEIDICKLIYGYDKILEKYKQCLVCGESKLKSSYKNHRHKGKYTMFRYCEICWDKYNYNCIKKHIKLTVENSIVKQCIECNICKPAHNFQICGKLTNGCIKRVSRCIPCHTTFLKTASIKYSITRKLSCQQYRNNNVDKIRKFKSEWYLKNAEKEKRKKVEYYLKNKERIHAVRREFTKNNPDKKIIRTNRSRLSRSLGTGKDHKKFLSCNKEHFYSWIQLCLDNDPDPEMIMKNQGKYFHLDHVIPCSKWNFTNEEHKKMCFHWSNISPLEARKNISKQNKILPEQIKEHIRRLKLFEKETKEDYSKLIKFYSKVGQLREIPKSL